MSLSELSVLTLAFQSMPCHETGLRWAWRLTVQLQGSLGLQPDIHFRHRRNLMTKPHVCESCELSFPHKLANLNPLNFDLLSKLPPAVPAYLPLNFLLDCHTIQAIPRLDYRHHAS